MSIEQHGMKFVVDTTSVAKGFRDYKSAVDGIFASLDKFEAHVTSTMKGVASAANNKAALSSFKNALGSFSDVKIDASTVRAVGALSAAMKDFRAPSASQSTNLRTFGKALATLPNLTNVYRTIKSIDDLNVAMRGFKAPPMAQAKNLQSFARTIQQAMPMLNALSGLKNVSSSIGQLSALGTALARFKSPSASAVTNLGNFALAMRSFNFHNLSGSGNLFATLAALGNFRAPSPAQVRNLVNFAHAVGQIKVPSNASSISTYLHSISTAAAQANGAMVRFRGGMAGTSSGFSGFSHGVGNARLEMMGLQNAFSGTFQIGSLLRSLLGSLTIGEIGREFFEATQSANQFHASMVVVTDNLSEQEGAWKRTQMAADHFGVDLVTYAGGFAKFAAAAHESGASLKETTKIYEGFQTVTTAMHLGTEQQQSVGLALREGMDRGYVSTQTLTRQLGLVLPGALATAQKAWKDANGQQANFFDALKKRQVDSIWLFDKLADHYATAYGPALKQALESPVQQFSILKNRVTEFMQEIAKAGAQKGFADLLAKMSSYLNPEDMQKYADLIAGKLVVGLKKAGDMIDWLATNWGKIKGPLGETLKLLGEWLVVSGLLKIGSSIVTPLINVGFAAKTAAPLIMDTVRATRALAAADLTGFYAQLSKINNPAIVAGVTKLSTGFGSIQTAIGSSTVLSGAVSVMGELGTAVSGVGIAAAGLGVAFLSGAKAARDSGIQLRSDQYTTGEIVKGLWLEVTGSISGAWASVTDFIGSAWKNYAWPGIQWFVNIVGKAVSESALFISYVFSSAVNGVSELFIGLAKSIYNTLSTAGSAFDKLKGGDWAGAKTDALSLVTFKGVRDGMTEAFSNMESYGSFKKNVGKGFAFAFDDTLAKAGASGRAANAAANKPGLHQGKKPTVSDWLDAQGDQTGRDSHYGGPDSGKGKGKKDKSFNAMKSEVDGIDSLLAKLTSDDPIGKIVQGWTNTLDDAAKLLLDKSGYGAVVKNFAGDTQDAQKKLAALEAQLRSGNLTKGAAAALKAKGLSPEDLIARLDAAREDINEKISNALEKQVTAGLKGQMAALKRVSEDDLVLKVRVEASDDIQGLSKNLLSADGYKDMLPTLRSLADGTGNVGAAFGLLKQQLLSGGAAAGMSKEAIDAMSKSLDTSAQAFALNTAKAERDTDVIASFFKKEQDALTLSKMTADAQQITSKMQELVNAALERKIILTKDEMTAAQQRLEQIQQENQLLEKQKTLFENNGMRQYYKDTVQAGDLVNSLDKDALQGLEDTLDNLGTKGKISFTGLLNSMQSDIIKWASHGITEKMISLVKPKAAEQVANGENPSLFGGLLAKVGIVPKNANNNAAAYKSQTDLVGQFGSKTPGVVDPKTGLLMDENTPQQANTVAASSFQQAIGQTFQPLATQFQSALSTAISNASGAPGGGITGTAGSIIGAAGNAPVIGGLPLPAANDNTPTLAYPDVTKLLNSDTSVTGGTPSIPRSAKGSGTASMIDMLGMSAMMSSKKGSATGILGGLMSGGVFGALGSAFGGGAGGMLGTMVSKMLTSGGSGGGGLLGSLFGGGGATSGGGGGGILSSLFGGLGGGASAGGGGLLSMLGLFKEGGITGSPVSTTSMSPAAFTNAPHFSEGTSNTSGIPAVLHDNEAVIPLSRGRKVPVEMSGGSGGGAPIVNQSFNFTTPDADSFRKSKQQIATDYYVHAGRAYNRNH